MSTPQAPVNTYAEKFDQEKKDMQAALDAQAGELERLPFGVKGIAKAFYALLRAVGVPILAAILALGGEFKLAGGEWFGKERQKIEFTRDDDWWVDVFERFGFSTTTIEGLKATIPKQLAGSWWMAPLMVILYVLNIMRPLSNVIIGEDVKNLMARFTPSVPGAGDVLRAAFIAPELYDQVERVLKQNGFSEDDIKLMLVNQYRVHDPNTLREIYWRTGQDKAWLEEHLAELGYTPARIKELEGIWEQIPPLQDIITMMAHEAFEPRFIQMFGLGDGYPEELTQWAQAHGLNPDWAFKYWVSHWIHPGLQNVLDMFHRGQVTIEQMREFFALVEIPPFWRDRIIKTAYNPYTRVDVRRMHLMGVLDDAQLKRAYMDLGYDDEKSDKMVEWTIKYNQGAEKELSRGDIEKAYEDGDLSFTQCLQLLVSIGYTESLAGFYLSRIDLEKDRSRRMAALGVVKEQYLAHLVTTEEARNAMLQMGFTVVRISELFDLWEAQRIRNLKLPSKTDLDKFLRNKIVDEPTYRAEMGYLGYKSKYIDWYLELIQAGETGA